MGEYSYSLRLKEAISGEIYPGTPEENSGNKMLVCNITT